MSDERPAVAIGHVTLRVGDIEDAARFYAALGLRRIMATPTMAILELRGGTHLLLFRAKGTPRAGRVRSFDFMVDDVDVARERLAGEGIVCSPASQDRLSGHRWFEVTDPDGHVIGVYSSHAENRPV